LAEQGRISPDEVTVVYITGNGLKTTEAVASAIGQPFTIDPQLSSFHTAWEQAQITHPHLA
jgi:threonine synthase